MITIGRERQTETASDLEGRTQQIGRALYRRTAAYRPGLLEAAGDRVMVLLARDPSFRARVLRFVDALSGLEHDRGGGQVARLLREYLSGDFPHLPLWLRTALPVLRSDLWPAPLVATTARTATRVIASRFIAVNSAAGVRSTLAYLREHGRTASFDILGEYVASEPEADAYRDQYLQLLRRLAGEAWRSRTDAGGDNPGDAAVAGDYPLQVSVKLSSLAGDYNPLDPAGTLARVAPRLAAIIDAARRARIGVTLDMERYETRDLTMFIFAELFGPGRRYGDWPGIGVVLQAYLRDADEQASALLDLAERRGVPFGIRLVKGAYWDYETVVAGENGWPAPVWQVKADTDRCFERLTERLIAAYPAVRPAIASHNLRSHAHAEAVREARGLPPRAIEHQTLYRTAEGISRALARSGWRVRDYVPLGDLLPGMAYLVRRILENSSQTGFLLQSRSGEPVEQLLAPPRVELAVASGGDRSDGMGGSSAADATADPLALRAGAASGTQPHSSDEAAAGHQELPRFRNHPPRRLYIEQERQEFAAALDVVRVEFGREYPLRLGGEVVHTADRVAVTDPSHPESAPLGWMFNAGAAEVERALDRATAAADVWAARPVTERADILRRAADRLAAQRDRFAAWAVHEAAKSWLEASADVDEAIDYLRWYALQAERLDAAWQDYRPRGVVAVIPPWNFPLAIPCGMTVAALVSGSAVVLKPAEQTPLIARHLVTLLHEAGVPEDVLIWLPGAGEVAGAALVASPRVDMVAFTGSRGVGTAIFKRGSGLVTQRGGLRATVAEMGGKNPIIVLPDADLDEAVVGILRSAFGHANQKCSAASRILIHQDIFDRLCRRLVAGAHDLAAGPADDPATLITPLIDVEARERVRRAAATARREGQVLLDDLDRPEAAPALGPVLVQISAARSGTARTTQEEIFGPVLALIPVKDEAEAVRIANDTAYGLTAGVFSRSPAAVGRIVAALEAGNVYVNRPTTGARVGVEPFGGHKLSGTGPKAGGEEYLWAFVTWREGLRPGGVLPSGSRRPTPNSVRPWPGSPFLRGRVVRRALTLLRQERPATWEAAGGSAALLDALAVLVRRVPELGRPQPTVDLPGQETTVRWDTPRGVGLLVADAGAPIEQVCALLLGALLAGNGVLASVSERHRPLLAVLLGALRAAGMPGDVVDLAADGLDLETAAHLPEVTFAAADLGLDAMRTLASLLAEASGGNDSPHLKAVFTLADGPGPEQAGFLRRFALPKTVAVRTLHLGAELEMDVQSGAGGLA